jgi:hypothetical protein
MAQAPFNGEQQLCNKLEIIRDDTNPRGKIRLRADQARPAAQPVVDPVETLPGDPRIELHDADIHTLLEEELTTEKLDDMKSYYFLMTTQSSDNISSLTEQIVRGRKIAITENPGLHLVWIQDRVFLKPLPEYLLSYDFWQHFLLSDTSPIKDEVRRTRLLLAARGFLRSYFYLIQRKSDFLLATKDDTKVLIPGGGDMTYEKFYKLIKACKANISDDDVSARWQVGEIRLTRLNFWSLLTRRGTYQRVEWQSAAYFTQFFGPILFVFAVFSLLLSSMSLVLSVQPVLKPDIFSWTEFARAARGFALFTIFAVLCVILFFVVTLAVPLLDEAVFALKNKEKDKAGGGGNGQAPVPPLPGPAFENGNGSGDAFANV